MGASTITDDNSLTGQLISALKKEDFPWFPKEKEIQA